jgi:hypothetical protein
MGNERRPRQERPLSPEEVAELQEMDRQWRLNYMPPQLDVNGIERVCVLCHSVLNPLHNRNYDATVGGFCNKLCAKKFERKCVSEGMTMQEADVEVGKCEEWKPVRHSPVVV